MIESPWVISVKVQLINTVRELFCCVIIVDESLSSRSVWIKEQRSFGIDLKKTTWHLRFPAYKRVKPWHSFNEASHPHITGCSHSKCYILMGCFFGILTHLKISSRHPLTQNVSKAWKPKADLSPIDTWNGRAPGTGKVQGWGRSRTSEGLWCVASRWKCWVSTTTRRVGFTLGSPGSSHVRSQTITDEIDRTLQCQDTCWKIKVLQLGCRG